MEKLKLGIIIGSVREGRFSEHTAKFITELAKNHGEFEVTVLDLKDTALPFLDKKTSPSWVTGSYGDEATDSWAKKIQDLDAYIMVTPEYNHAPSAVLKNAIDSIAHEWGKKPVGFVAHGSVGGARAVEHLRQIAVEMDMVPVRNAVHIIGGPWNLLDEAGNIKAGTFDHYAKSAENMLADISWWGKITKNAKSA